MTKEKFKAYTDIIGESGGKDFGAKIIIAKADYLYDVILTENEINDMIINYYIYCEKYHINDMQKSEIKNIYKRYIEKAEIEVMKNKDFGDIEPIQSERYDNGLKEMIEVMYQVYNQNP